MNDIELIELLQKDPQEGLRECIHSYGATVQWIVTKIVGSNNREDIEECVSDVFAKLWRNAHYFDDRRETKLSSYLYGIARNTALDYRKSRQHDLEQIPVEENDLHIDADFTDEYAKKVNSQIVQHTVDLLPQPDRDIFIYRYYFRLKISEIAERLDLKPKQVENKLFRGKEVLRKQLMEGGIIL